MPVQTLDEILREHDRMKYPKPAPHDPLCHMQAHAECDWWGWHGLEVSPITENTDSTD